MHNINIFACNEHVNLAIDDFINKNEEAPEIITAENCICSYCNKKAIYEVKSIKDNNKITK